MLLATEPRHRAGDAALIGRERDRPEARTPGAMPPYEELPFCIELRAATDHAAVERVLARASNAALARAIFKAAREEHPDRRVTLSRGTRIIADSSR
jgi:hypothetical protein